MEAPSKYLVGAQVLAWATVSPEVQFTGRLCLFVDGTRIGRVPALAIALNPEDGEMLLLHCDSMWEVIGVQAWNAPDAAPITSVEEMKDRAEQYYSGLMPNWVTVAT